MYIYIWTFLKSTRYPHVASSGSELNRRASQECISRTRLGIFFFLNQFFKGQNCWSKVMLNMFHMIWSMLMKMMINHLYHRIGECPGLGTRWSLKTRTLLSQTPCEVWSDRKSGQLPAGRAWQPSFTAVWCLWIFIPHRYVYEIYIYIYMCIYIYIHIDVCIWRYINSYKYTSYRYPICCANPPIFRTPTVGLAVWTRPPHPASATMVHLNQGAASNSRKAAGIAIKNHVYLWYLYVTL